MKKTFDFGKVDFNGTGRRINRLTVDVEYTDGRFSASGNIWSNEQTDCFYSGQCLDELNKFLHSNPTFQTIYRLWDLYHLNDLRPYCEHQKELGWVDIARKEVLVYCYKMKHKTLIEQLRVERLAKERPLTSEERKIYVLKYCFETWQESNDERYELECTKMKTLGWLHPEEHPDGLLTKPCPVCGYGYGTKWMFEQIPQEDVEIIENLLKD